MFHRLPTGALVGDSNAQASDSDAQTYANSQESSVLESDRSRQGPYDSVALVHAFFLSNADGTRSCEG